MSSVNETLEVQSPYDLSIIDKLTLARPSEVELALANAAGLAKAPQKMLPGQERIAILERLAELMEENKDELAQIALSEGGKPLLDTRVEVDRAINGVKLAVYSMHELSGKEIAMGLSASSQGRKAFTVREPIGVIAALSAFNHPLNLIVHQTVPAIAVGAPVIVKPALSTPFSCLKFVDLVHQAGLPKEWCQAIVCDNTSAEMLATDDRVSYLSFIGSAKVGWYLRSKLAAGTRCGLEHGGAAPVIVEPDADIEDLVPLLAKGGLYHAGQVCVSVQRVFAHREIVKDLAEKLIKKAEDMTVGDPAQERTAIGPLILPREVDRVESWVKEAVEGGAELLLGGERISDTCFQATVLFNPPPKAKVSCEEIFGPVICLYDYQDRADAIGRANELPFAFQASCFTKDLDVAFEVSNQLNAAAVMVNDHTAFRVDWMPFGGRDASGLGVGGIPYSMEEMTREKLIVFRSKAWECI